jgi:energy-coupling factor transporter ATP-binding protein EcfA2
MSSAEALSKGTAMPDAIVSYLLKLTRDDGIAPRSTVGTFVEPQVRAHADGATAGSLEVLQAESRLLLLGVPGSGKSTAIKVLAHQMASTYLGSMSGVFPVLVAASRLRPPAHDPCNLPPGYELWSWLAAAAASLAGAGLQPIRPLAAALTAGDAHLFVDGLDEIADGHERSRVADALDYLQGESHGLKICVSTRPAGGGTKRSLDHFAVWSMLPFDDAQARQLLSRLTGSRELEVQHQVDAAPLGSLAESPLMLRLLSLYTAEHGLVLPRSRLQLFEDLADAILAREQRVAARPISISTLHRGHEIASEAMAKAGKSTLSVSELASALVSYPGGAFTEDDADFFVRMVQDRVAILTQTSADKVCFAYRTFQDFYLGRALRGMSRSSATSCVMTSARRSCLPPAWPSTPHR